MKEKLLSDLAREIAPKCERCRENGEKCEQVAGKSRPVENIGREGQQLVQERKHEMLSGESDLKKKGSASRGPEMENSVENVTEMAVCPSNSEDSKNIRRSKTNISIG